MPMRSNCKFENSLFSLYYLNKDILFNIPLNFMKFEKHVHDGHSGEARLDFCSLGLRFYLMQYRTFCLKKLSKVNRFLT